MQLFFALLVGKLITFLTKKLNIGGGSAAPGLYALKICPDLIQRLTQKIPQNIIITGTNGKTTTARMIAHFAKSSNLKVVRNHTGSNLERGIASALISHSSFISSNSHADLGIWEVDEAAFNTLVPKINPNIIVFLNAFRDQLDRYGEVDSVVNKWQESLKRIDKKTLLLINADDTNTSKMLGSLVGNIQTFGIKDRKIVGERSKQKNTTDQMDFSASNLVFNNLSSIKFEIKENTNALKVNLPIPGLYHVYDFLAAFALGKNLGLKTETMLASLESFAPAFGRVEKIKLTNSKEGCIFLIKNPVGATQVFETIAPALTSTDRILLALNDNFADGKDISWIWDADFEQLKIQKNTNEIIISGTRAYDLGVRLKYAGFETSNISIESDLTKALQQAQIGLEGRLLILPTYTAMLELQNILTKQGIKKHYWEEKN